MQYYVEPERQIPIRKTTEVLVVGSGPSGIGAALAAARGGVRTMLIEQGGTVGGISTAGLMSHWTGTADSRLYREILMRSAALNEGAIHNKPVIQIDPEKLKMLYLEMLLEAGVEVQLYTFACGAVMEQNRICGVITESKSGREMIGADIVIDASGDGDIAAKAGVPYTLGRASDGGMQPATIMFKVAGVDETRAVFLGSFESTYQTGRGELQALAKQHLPHPAGHVLLYKSTLPGVVTCNMTNCTGIDGTKTEDLTRAEVTCRRQIDAIIRFLREFVPGYENCFLISSASLMGIRETRHFHGRYTLTEQDILEARVFPDWVVKGAHFNFDVHNIAGAGLDETGVQERFPQDKGYTIPYRCFLPEQIDGLLFTGRTMSGTHMAHSNFRAMPICLAMGEGCGTAAAISIQNRCALCDVPVEEVQKRL